MFPRLNKGRQHPAGDFCHWPFSPWHRAQRSGPNQGVADHPGQGALQTLRSTQRHCRRHTTRARMALEHSTTAPIRTHPCNIILTSHQTAPQHRTWHLSSDYATGA